MHSSKNFFWMSWCCLHEVNVHFFLLLIPWRMMSYWMELVIRIYGFFKKMDPRILCTLTAPQNLTLSSKWRNIMNCMVHFRTPLWYFGCLYSHLLWTVPLPKMKEDQARIKKSVAYQYSRSLSIPPSCFPVCGKISCMGVILYTCSFKSFVDIRSDVLTFHFEESAGTNIMWGLLPVKHQYHSTSLQLRHDVFLFSFVQHWTCHLNIFI